MKTPTIKGQFRRVRYTDDGCNIYQCLWCMNRVEIRDDPSYWNFCPICGKSWFTRLQCRDHETPRWAWDRYGHDDANHPAYHTYKKDERQWVIESRTKWTGEMWGIWHHETTISVRQGKLGVWRDAQYYLNQCRARASVEDGMGVQFEYRARLEKINADK